MTINAFMNAPYPSRHNASAAVWRAEIDRHRTVVVIQYAGENTFVARASYSDGIASQGITTYHHRSLRVAAAEAIRLSHLLPCND